MTQDITLKKKFYLPGEEGIWMFVLGDLLIFTLFFSTYLFYRGQEPELFAESQQSLNLALGTTNTIILITSSWLTALSVKALRDGKPRATKRLLLGAILFGCGFATLKIVEYYDKFSNGFGVGTNDFFMYFFMFTGIHFIHVIIGLFVLFFMRRAISHTETPSDKSIRMLESGATYWHMVDLLWIALFSLFYLLI